MDFNGGKKPSVGSCARENMLYIERINRERLMGLANLEKTDEFTRVWGDQLKTFTSGTQN